MRRATKYWLLGLLLLVSGTYALAEQLTMVTYYPSPRGVYEELRISRTAGLGGGFIAAGNGPAGPGGNAVSPGFFGSDSAALVPVNSPNLPGDPISDLRLYILDDFNDRFSIWGDSCNGGTCGSYNATKNLLTVLGSGDVGIGTAPLTRLHVAGNGRILRLEGTDHAYLEWYPDGPATRRGWIGYGSDVDNNLTITNQISNADIVLATTGVTGNVGINDSTPSYALDVSGDANVTGKVREGGNALIPTGAVMFFNLTTCPTGWSAFTSATGRYIVGATSSIGSTVGTALSNLQNRSDVAPHGHTATASQPAHLHGVDGGNPWKSGANGGNWNNVGWIVPGTYMFGVDTTGSATPSITVTVSSAGSNNTNAPYVQLQACQKN